jgi:DNA-binding MarR family transcriptional regulator
MAKALDRGSGPAPRPTRLDLDETIHQPTRLAIVATLAHAERVDFAFLRDTLALGDSNLSRQLTALEAAGYVRIDKVFERKRPRTWLSLTPHGRAAFDAHVAALRRLLDGG